MGRIIKTEAKNFGEKVKAFGLSSLYTIREVINALEAIKQECIELKSIDIFDTNFISGYAKLEDFKHSQ